MVYAPFITNPPQTSSSTFVNRRKKIGHVITCDTSNVIQDVLKIGRKKMTRSVNWRTGMSEYRKKWLKQIFEYI